MGNIKTVWWFLQKPRYIPQIFQVLKRRKNKRMEDSYQEAISWCKVHSISQEAGLKKLFPDAKFFEIDKVYPAIIRASKKVEQSCPVKMGGEGAISLLYSLVKAMSANRIIETGVAYGWSTLAILLAIKDIHRAKLISNDMPYIKMNNDDFVGIIIPDDLKLKWELIRHPDIVGLPIALRKFKSTIDLIHYDSDKSYTGRMFAYPLVWKSLRKDGLFISDDIQDNIAFKDFCKSVDRKPIIVEHLDKYVGIIRK